MKSILPVIVLSWFSIPVLQVRGRRAVPSHRSEIGSRYAFRPFDRGGSRLLGWKRPRPGRSFLYRVDKNYQRNAAAVPLPIRVYATLNELLMFQSSRFPCENDSAKSLQFDRYSMRSAIGTGQNSCDQTSATTSLQTPLHGFPIDRETHRFAHLKLHVHAHLY